MLEIIASAGSPEGVTAAVQNGADAVVLSIAAPGAHAGAKNFTHDEFYRAAEYCRVRGVAVYLALDTLVSDDEFKTAVNTAVSAVKAGAGAVIVSDLGLLRALRNTLPDTPLHCGSGMNIHSLEGVRIAAAIGATRVVLARELPRDEIADIARWKAVELEVIAQGGVCASYCGQCYLSASTNRLGANRGRCRELCKQPYTTGIRKTDYPLSLREHCLVSHVGELEKVGIRAIRIEGSRRRPEYVAVMTGIYARAVRLKREPTNEELHTVVEAFSHSGLTDGYYTAKTGENMLAAVEGESVSEHKVYHTTRKNYLNGEYQRVPVRFAAELKLGRNARIVAADERRNTATAVGGLPEPAFHRVTDTTALATAFHRTEGTPFYCAGVKSSIEPDIVLESGELTKMCRNVLAQLLEKRKELPPLPKIVEFMPPLVDAGRSEPPVLTVSIMRASQLSKELLALEPAVLYVPVSEFRHAQLLRPFIENPTITVAAALPRVIFSSQQERINKILEAASRAGVSDVLVSNVGHILPMREMGFNVRGDYGLNIFSSHSLATAGSFGLSSVMLSFEMSLDQIRAAAKPVDTEIFAYGRLPLMYTENCIIKLALGVCTCEGATAISDAAGAKHPVMRAETDSCRNVVYSPRKVFLADRMGDFKGAWGMRLAFSTENAQECAAVLRRYSGIGQHEPGGITRGLYYKGVQ